MALAIMPLVRSGAAATTQTFAFQQQTGCQAGKREQKKYERKGIDVHA